MEYDNTNRGVLFTNKKKNEKQPDFTGQINIEGKEWEISGWKKTSAKGTEFTSLGNMDEPNGMVSNSTDRDDVDDDFADEKVKVCRIDDPECESCQ